MRRGQLFRTDLRLALNASIRLARWLDCKSIFPTIKAVIKLCSSWINYGITNHIDTNRSIAWRIPSKLFTIAKLRKPALTYTLLVAVQIIPSGLLALMIPILKESPTWLLKKTREEEAYRVYSYIRNLPVDHPYIVEDVSFVEAQIQTERILITGGDPSFSAFLKGVGKEAFMKGNRNRFALVFLMFMWQGWSGAAVINYCETYHYAHPSSGLILFLTIFTLDSPTIFTSIGLTNITFWTGIYGLIRAICSIIFFVCFIDTFGRKWPWIVSCVICAICQYYLAAYIAIGKPSLDGPQSASTVAGGKAATSAIMIFAAAWSFGANGLPWIISSEIFSSSLRSVSGPFAAVSQWLWTYVVTKALPSMYTSLGYGIYVFFATSLICAAVYAFFFIHETKGLRMDQMDQLFGCMKVESTPLVARNNGVLKFKPGEEGNRKTKSNVSHLEL